VSRNSGEMLIPQSSSVEGTGREVAFINVDLSTEPSRAEHKGRFRIHLLWTRYLKVHIHCRRTPWASFFFFMSKSFFLKIYLFIICKYTVAVFRHSRRGHQILLQMVVSHHVVPGIWTPDLRKSSRVLLSTEPSHQPLHEHLKCESGNRCFTIIPTQNFFWDGWEPCTWPIRKSPPSIHCCPSTRELEAKFPRCAECREILLTKFRLFIQEERFEWSQYEKLHMCKHPDAMG
jgi:hypothetical protein